MRRIALACLVLAGCYGHHGRQKHEATTSMAGIVRAYEANPVRADERYDGLPLTVTAITVKAIESGFAVAEGGKHEVRVELDKGDLVRLNPGSVISAKCEGARMKRGAVVLLDCVMPR